MQDIVVSINCITYNHEPYLRDALDSFLMQKTNFGFEILIHDDASTDHTADIIREYQEKYPDKIKPILQVENQQSKGVSKVCYRFNHTRAEGKYIAVCEGDDYWTDEYKLQKQVDYMEENPECTFCFHNAHVIQNKKKHKGRLVIPWMSENRNYYSGGSRAYSSGELQLLGFVPTASYLFPKYVLDHPPKWFFDAPVGDNAMKLMASSFGYAYYMEEPMCVYRFHVPNSATTKWAQEPVAHTIRRCNRFIKMLDEFNEYSDFRYYDDITLSKLTWEIHRLFLLGDKKGLKSKENRRYLTLFRGPYKAKYYLMAYFPFGARVLKKIKNLF